VGQILTRKILNPYTKLKGYNCFGCSPDNQHGLKMEFSEDGEFVVCHWRPQDHFSGYKNVLHGGIQATLMDEITAWAIQVKMKSAGVTAGMNVRFIKSLSVKEERIIIKAKIEKVVKQIAFVKTEIFNTGNELCSEGEIKYFVYPPEEAKLNLYYPGYENFFR
jgi:uncharacterized protein (TIGR00369 family)